jgi:hypothetical protein
MEGYNYEATNNSQRKGARGPVIKENEDVGVTQRSIRELFD